MRTRFWKLALATAACGLIGGQAAMAQQRLASPAAPAVRPVAHSYNAYYYQTPAGEAPAPSAAAAAPEAAHAAPQDFGAAADNHIGAGCDPVGCDPNGCEPVGCDTGCCEDDGPEWTLRGWIDQGFTWNPDNPVNNTNGINTFNDRANEYQLNQVYMILQNEIDTEAEEWDVGGRLDLLYGSDYYYTMARGLEYKNNFDNRWNGEDGPRAAFNGDPDGWNIYGLAMPQAYAEVYAPIGPGFTVKAGHFYTLIGYETVTAPDNFFYSHAYTMQYGEPFTHTGVIVSNPLGENWTVSNGVVRGWDNWEDNNENLSYLGSISYTSQTLGTVVTLAGIIGAENDEFPNGALQSEERYMYSFVVNQPVTERLRYVFQHDAGWDEGFEGGGDADDAEWYSAYNYLLYQINCNWAAGVRAGWFRDDDGFRTSFSPQGLPPAGIPFAGNYYELTAGLNWKPTDNLVLRPEVRYDWTDIGDGVQGAYPYDDFNSGSQITVGTDLILTY